MVKIARERPMALVSRSSGRWLIGGAFLLSLAVLAWALQGDTSAGPTRPLHRPAPARRSELRADPARTQISVEELATRPPSAGDYGPLLQDNVFQPRVITRQGRGTGKDPASGNPAAPRHPGSGGKGAAAVPTITEAWHDWKYTGIAQLDQQTYALMDQPDKKESRFVKVGDQLEDATVAQVAENEVTLRGADGSVVRMKRVDPAADLLRTAHPATTPPSTLAPGSGPVSTAPSGQAISPGPAATSAAADDASQGGRRGRGRRSQQLDGAGSAGGQ